MSFPLQVLASLGDLQMPTFQHALQHDVQQVLVSELRACGRVAVLQPLQGDDEVGHPAHGGGVVADLQLQALGHLGAPAVAL